MLSDEFNDTNLWLLLTASGSFIERWGRLNILMAAFLQNREGMAVVKAVRCVDNEEMDVVAMRGFWQRLGWQ
jgi:hypothetical protein